MIEEKKKPLLSVERRKALKKRLVRKAEHKLSLREAYKPRRVLARAKKRVVAAAKNQEHYEKVKADREEAERVEAENKKRAEEAAKEKEASDKKKAEEAAKQQAPTPVSAKATMAPAPVVVNPVVEVIDNVPPVAPALKGAAEVIGDPQANPDSANMAKIPE